MNAPSATADELYYYVTVSCADQLLGLPIDRVQDVFIAQQITPVPLAPAEIVGLINLRGRVVTAISLRRRLGRRDTLDDACSSVVAVGIDDGGEAYALIVDAVGEVLQLDAAGFEPVPIHLNPSWAALAAGIHRLDDRLLLVLDVDRVLALDLPAAA